MVTIHGKLIDIGQLEFGLGFIVAPNSGNEVTVTGFSISEVKALAPLFGENIIITIRAAG